MSSITLRPFQEDVVVNPVISTIKDIEALQRRNRINEDDARIVIKSPTGSGKTVMISQIIERYLKDKYVTILLSPGQGSLEGQTRSKLNEYFGDSGTRAEVITPTSVSTPFRPGDVYVSNWEKLIRRDRDTNEYSNIITKNNERGNLESALTVTAEQGTPIAIIIDESHYGGKSHDNKIVQLLNDIHDWVMSASDSVPIIIEASATPIERQGHSPARTVRVSYSDVRDAELMRKSIIRNDSDKGGLTITAASDSDDAQNLRSEDILLSNALNRLNEIDAAYARAGEDYHGLIGVNIPNGKLGNDARERVREWFSRHGITAENGQLVEYMDDSKTADIASISDPSSPARVLIYKQAIALGWDCPRAQILVGFRHIKSKIFSIQNIGRFLRTTNGKYYGPNEDMPLNYMYVYDNSTDADIMGDPDSIVKDDPNCISEDMSLPLQPRAVALVDMLNRHKLPRTYVSRRNTTGFTVKDVKRIIAPAYNKIDLRDNMASDTEALQSGELDTRSLDNVNDGISFSNNGQQVNGVMAYEDLYNVLYKQIISIVSSSSNVSNNAMLTRYIIIIMGTLIMADKRLPNVNSRNDAIKIMLQSDNLRIIKDAIRTALDDELNDDNGIIVDKNKNSKVITRLSPLFLDKTIRVPRGASAVPDSLVGRFLYASSHRDRTDRKMRDYAWYPESGNRSVPEKHFEDMLDNLFDESNNRFEMAFFLKTPPYALCKQSMSMAITLPIHTADDDDSNDIDKNKSRIANFFPDYLIFIRDHEPVNATDSYIPMIIEIKSREGNSWESEDDVSAKSLAMEQYMEHTGMPMGLFHDEGGIFTLHEKGSSFIDFLKDHSGDKLKTFDDDGNVIRDVINASTSDDSHDSNDASDASASTSVGELPSSLSWMSGLGSVA